MPLSPAGIAGTTDAMPALSKPSNMIRRFVVLLSLACLLGACGGGGGDAGTVPAAVQNGSNDPGPVATGPWTVRLTWNATGDAGVYGYRVYHGVAADNMSDRSDLIGTTSADISVGAAGRHYFSVVAVDAYNQESPHSETLAMDLN